MVNREIAEKTISFALQTSKVTGEVLREIFSAYLDGKLPHGKISYEDLSSRGKMESIEITENNIGDFLKIARKYDIDYALKRDISTEPPTYHVFFTSSKSENFRRAFGEYVGQLNSKISERSVSKAINREQIKKNAEIIAQKSATISQEKHLSLSGIAGR